MNPAPRLSGPSRTIVHWLRDAYKTSFLVYTMELKIKLSTIVINTQEPSVSG